MSDQIDDKETSPNKKEGKEEGERETREYTDKVDSEKIKPTAGYSTKSGKRTGAELGIRITRKKRKSVSSDEHSPEPSSSMSPRFEPMDASKISSENPSQHSPEPSSSKSLPFEPMDVSEISFENPPQDSSASDNLPNSPVVEDFISFKNLELSDDLLRDQPNSVHDSGGNSGGENSFQPNSFFRNLLYTSSNDEVEESSLQGSIFQPNLPSDAFSEEQHILRDIRTALENEDKLQDSASQTETFYVHHTVDKDVFKNPSKNDNQDCYDWDEFLDRWEPEFHDLKISEESEVHPREIITDIKRRKSKRLSQNISFSGQAEKRTRIADSPETAQSTTLESSSSYQELISRTISSPSSNQNVVLSSNENETELTVYPVSADVSETSTTSKLEDFIKNTKIKLSEDRQISPFAKKIISLEHESLPTRKNGYLSNESSDYFEKDMKQNLNCGTNSNDNIEELTGIVGDLSVSADNDGNEMVS